MLVLFKTGTCIRFLQSQSITLSRLSSKKFLILLKVSQWKVPLNVETTVNLKTTWLLFSIKVFTSFEVLIGHNSEKLCPLFVEEFGKKGRKNVGNIHCLTCFMDTHLDETQNFILRNSWVTSDPYWTLYKTRDSGELKYSWRINNYSQFK